ncbi:unannotated protein [freshwater metagenome]|uniref:Unannotated protein n=1 Tax=freshwater metagenome TaxID=449393 RepID=A0A6J7KS98_9ZZZZ
MEYRSYSLSPRAAAATVVAVPATAMRVVAFLNGTDRAASAIAASISSIAAATVRASGGCFLRWRSVIRTQPIFTLFADSTFSAPKTNSVEPPPISTTRNGPPIPLSSFVAPMKERAASSAPGITSGSIPKISRTPSINTWRLRASRVALVAQNLIFSTPLLAMISANLLVASSVRSIAAGSNARFLSTPSPSRTISISRITSRKLSPSISAMSRRIELVPQSIAATLLIYYYFL